MIARRGLFLKYVVVLVALVSGALLASGGIELWFSYREHRASLLALQNEKAVGAAARIEAFVREIERQMGWTTQPQLVAPSAALEQRRIDFYRLQKQVQPITELQHLDAGGKERLRISRLSMDVIDSGEDFSDKPRFTEARSRTWFGPVYFRKDSEPYMTIAMPVSGGGVIVAEVNLKFIWDVVLQIKVGASGRAFVLDGQGNLIAHPDISLVLQKTSFAQLPHVQAALSATTDGEVPRAVDAQGREVLAAYSVIMPLRWAVFVEQPIEEAMAPLRASVTRTLALIFLGVAASLIASVVLARRMVRPIHTLQEGAARIGAGELAHRLDVRTGDELQALAAQFNDMTSRLRESYATLERRVEERTRELTEALEQQTATAEILRVMSSSPTDVQPVFDSIAASAARLCGASFGGVMRRDPDGVRLTASHNMTEAQRAFFARPELLPYQPAYDTAVGAALLESRVVHIRDVLQEPPTPVREATRQALGYRTFLAVPMLREGVGVGVIVVWRPEPAPFSDAQIELLKTFADQAVIAIENVRLFTELQEKNRAITEALEQQTATSEILRVISSSPTDVEPVFDTIVRSAAQLCDAAFGGVFHFDGTHLMVGAVHNVAREQAAPLAQAFPLSAADAGAIGESVTSRRVVHIPDFLAVHDPEREPEYLFARVQPLLGFRTVLVVPMLREGSAIGAIVIWRTDVRPFAESQIDLLKTFADQAVIAIENVRLFTELQEKNRQVTEALERQTATGEILRVISSSPTDVQPVFEAIVEHTLRLCDGLFSAAYRYDGDMVHLAAHRNQTPTALELLARHYPGPANPQTVSGHALLARTVVHIDDVTTDVEHAASRELGRVLGFRTIVAVPMLREGVAIGSIAVARPAVRPLTDKEIDLIKTFADQAVIAIENVRLFNELQQRTGELGRTVGELEGLGEVSRTLSSTLDVDTVLQTIVSRAAHLAGTDGCSIYRYDDAIDAFVLRASYSVDSGGELVEAQRGVRIRRGEGVIGRLADQPQAVQVADITGAGAYEGPLRDILVRSGYRSLLAVPMIRDDRVTGGLVVSRKTPGGFSESTVALLQRFATQSILALRNASLFRELEDKSRELEVANRHKSEFLANMSHELRTPLNAVIGFSEVLLEKMFGDINDKQDEYLRDIYSSGRHLLSLINDILDLAKIEAGRMELEVTRFDLPQAIENAMTLVRGRADAHAIRLEAEIDQRLGEFAGDERKFKQILLNLLSNAVKFTPEGGRVALRAGLTNGTVEIAVTDTGIGIAPEDQRAVFEEFRQVGTDYARKREGTGLGLALTKRFVELHGGAIWLKSAPGEGATFTFTLPVRPWPTSSS